MFFVNGLKIGNLQSEMDTDRVYPLIGSGRVGSGRVTGQIQGDFGGSGRGSDLLFTSYFYALFSIVFILTVVGQNSTDQCVVQEQIPVTSRKLSDDNNSCAESPKTFTA